MATGTFPGSRTLRKCECFDCVESSLIQNPSCNLLTVPRLNCRFREAISFDADLSGWDVSAATTMSTMFLRARSFSGSGLQSWNVSQVGNFFATFWYASNFNEDLSQWDVGSVTQMIYMLRAASAFSHDLCYWGDKTSESLTGAFAVFQDSGCSDTGDPDLKASPKGPFCQLCSPPTASPSNVPSLEPSQTPTMVPTQAPSKAPTRKPTLAPEPTRTPTKAPTPIPTKTPSEVPTQTPSTSPSMFPTPVPTAAPTYGVFMTRSELDTAIATKDWSSTQYGPVTVWDVSLLQDFSSKP